jgi:O-phosphoseryl-tRNA synthetase
MIIYRTINYLNHHGGFVLKRKEIIKLARKDFEKAWVETAQTLKKPHHDNEYPRIHLETGKSHMLYNTIWELRQTYLNLGFNETVNPVFVDEEDIYKQFGPEAPAVLDRCFYLAGLPRPDIGIGMDKIEVIEEVGVPLNEEKIQSLKDIFRSYKKGDESGDDLVHDVSNALEVEDALGLRILENVFPELRELKPIPSRTTLRSHMTSGWFLTLQSLHNKDKLPIKLFSIDRCFRREQREDLSHLMTYHSASCVWVDNDVNLDMGMAVSESVLEHFGFQKFKYMPDEKKSKYYIPGTQTEVYGYHPKLKEWVEVATFGIYSPIALSHYGIDKEVMNLGVGAERIAMILHNQTDVREMVYPQTYGKWFLSDRTLATMLCINYYPFSTEGRNLMDKLLSTARDNGNTPSPCQFTAFEGEFLGKNIKVTILEPEDGTKLLGPAAWNNIYIYDGNIVGVPETDINDEISLKAVENGIPTGISYMDGVSAYASYKIEEMIVSGAQELSIRTTLSKSISDVNLKLDKVALNYITGNNKVIDIRGPVFCTINCEVLE